MLPGAKRGLARRGAAVPLDREVPNGYSATPALRDRSCSVDVAAVGYVYHSHHTGLIVDPVDDPVGTATGAESVVHGREQSLADPVRIGK